MTNFTLPTHRRFSWWITPLMICLVLTGCGDGTGTVQPLTPGETLQLPTVTGSSVPARAMDLDNDGAVDGLDMDNAPETCELKLVNLEGSSAHAMDADGDGGIDVYLAPESVGSSTVWINTQEDRSGASVSLVLNTGGKPVGLDINGDGLFDICIVSASASGDNTAPRAIAFLPREDATDVPVNSTISVAFNECINPETITTSTLSLAHESGPIAGSVSYERHFNTAFFKPTAPLRGDSLYQATISAEIQDLAGNALADEMSWSFSTGTVTDSEAPSPGNDGTLTLNDSTHTSLTLNWDKASDDQSWEENLQYKVVQSTANIIDTVANAETPGDGRTVLQGWTADLTTLAVSSLAPTSAYYFNVLVKDGSGNKAAYQTVMRPPAFLPDTSPPTAGNAGTLTPSSVGPTSLTLNWTAATDDATAQANLQYLAYYSTSNNISSVADCEANGTAIGSFAANITTRNVTGLSPSTTYYFNVVVRDETGNKATYSTVSQATSDATPPMPGNSGTLTTSSVGPSSLTLTWTAATDNVTAQADLQYLAYYSTSNNIANISDCEANGTAVGSYTANITTRSVTGLAQATTYYFNVLVRDEAGNKVASISVPCTTSDVTSPMPGNSGSITPSSVGPTSLTLSWIAATDNVTAQANLQYLAYYSTSDNITSVADCEANGTAVGSYAANITSRNVTGLSSSTTYYFNVVVQDETGNKAAFTPVTQATTSTIPPDYIFRWKLNNNGNDETGSLNLSSQGGAPTYSTANAKEGSHCLVVDGNDHIFSPSSYILPTNAISISMWLYLDPSDTTGYPTAIALGDALTIYYDRDNSKLTGELSFETADFTSFSKGVWYHVIMTSDTSSYVRLYIDGNSTPVGTWGGSYNVTDYNAQWYVGSYTTGDYWNGLIDDVIIYDRTLSGSEVSEIYSAYQ